MLFAIISIELKRKEQPHLISWKKNEEEDIGFNIPFQANGSILNIGMNESSD